MNNAKYIYPDYYLELSRPVLDLIADYREHCRQLNGPVVIIWHSGDSDDRRCDISCAWDNLVPSLGFEIESKEFLTSMSTFLKQQLASIREQDTVSLKQQTTLTSTTGRYQYVFWSVPSLSCGRQLAVEIWQYSQELLCR